MSAAKTHRNLGRQSKLLPAEPKIRRQGKKAPKTHYHFKIQDGNYDWLCEQASKYQVSVAKVLNAILKDKPEPSDFYSEVCTLRKGS